MRIFLGFLFETFAMFQKKEEPLFSEDNGVFHDNDFILVSFRMVSAISYEQLLFDYRLSEST